MEKVKSIYYNYNFISAEPLVALVKEEFKSYFDTGAIDDLLFPIYIKKCLDKLGRGTLDIKHAILGVTGFQTRLPDDFSSVREVWVTTNVTESYKLPGAVYEQVMETCSTRIDTPDSYCEECADCCTPNTIRAIYKTTGTAFAYFQKSAMIEPGKDYDIQGNKLSTIFREGEIYMLYYSETRDCIGYPMIPDNYRIKEYIEIFLKAKVYENLANQTTDETFNQINSKAQQYKAAADEAYILADIEMKKETVYTKKRRILKQQNRLNKFDL